MISLPQWAVQRKLSMGLNTEKQGWKWICRHFCSPSCMETDISAAQDILHFVLRKLMWWMLAIYFIFMPNRQQGKRSFSQSSIFLWVSAFKNIENFTFQPCFSQLNQTGNSFSKACCTEIEIQPNPLVFCVESTTYPRVEEKLWHFREQIVLQQC